MDLQRRRMKNLAASARPHFLPTRFSPTFGPGGHAGGRTSPPNEHTQTQTGPPMGRQSPPEAGCGAAGAQSSASGAERRPADAADAHTTRPELVSTTKMSLKGPVSNEFTAQGTTPSGKPRVFVCATCTRAFARQEHLNRHERSHTKEKPFSCNICSRKFSRRDLLLRHSTKLHAGAAEGVPRLRKKSAKYTRGAESAAPAAHSTPSVGTEGTEGTLGTLFTRHTQATHASLVSSDTAFGAPSAPNVTNETLFGSKGVRKPRSAVRRKAKNEGLQLPVLTENTHEDAAAAIDLDAAYRRASFSAMSGNNYATGIDLDYATETVEFSTPQYYPSVEDLKTVVESNEDAGASYIDSWLSQTAEDPKYKGYSFYNDLDESKLAEDFGKANLGPIGGPIGGSSSVPGGTLPSPFKKGSQLDPK